MRQDVENFARFYALLKKLPGADKEELVWQFTDGRTKSLREVRTAEYERMCREMERVADYDERREALRQELRQRRSVCLKLMQKIGVDTTDWRTVNSYCRSPKIAGVEFRDLDIDDLNRLSLKLRIILKKQRKQH